MSGTDSVSRDLGKGYISVAFTFFVICHHLAVYVLQNQSVEFH